MKITFKVLTGPEEFTTYVVKRIGENLKAKTKEIAIQAEEAIKRNINTIAAMPTGHLADSFFKEQIDETTWGIGNITYLNQYANYWRHVNFGSRAIGADWQHFLPKGRWGYGGRFETDPIGYSGLMPNTPVPALNYIEKTLLDLKIIAHQAVKGKKGK